MGLPFRNKTEVSGATIRWDYHLEAMAEVSGGTIRWNYHLEVKQRYHVELPGRSMPICIRCIRHFEVKANV